MARGSRMVPADQLNEAWSSFVVAKGLAEGGSNVYLRDITISRMGTIVLAVGPANAPTYCAHYIGGSERFDTTPSPRLASAGHVSSSCAVRWPKPGPRWKEAAEAS
jgi:hypothetical protein